jgi:hypothetical protein
MVGEEIMFPIQMAIDAADVVQEIEIVGHKKIGQPKLLDLAVDTHHIHQHIHPLRADVVLGIKADGAIGYLANRLHFSVAGFVEGVGLLAGHGVISVEITTLPKFGYSST